MNFDGVIDLGLSFHRRWGCLCIRLWAILVTHSWLFKNLILHLYKLFWLTWLNGANYPTILSVPVRVYHLWLILWILCLNWTGIRRGVDHEFRIMMVVLVYLFGFVIARCRRYKRKRRFLTCWLVWIRIVVTNVWLHNIWISWWSAKLGSLQWHPCWCWLSLILRCILAG